MFLDFPKDGGSHVSCENHSSDNRVRNNERLSGACKLKAQPAVDDAQDYQDSAIPDMSVGDKTTLLVLDIIKVMEVSSDWLDTEECNHYGAEKSVIFGEVLRLQLAWV